MTAFLAIAVTIFSCLYVASKVFCIRLPRKSVSIYAALALLLGLLLQRLLYHVESGGETVQQLIGTVIFLAIIFAYWKKTEHEPLVTDSHDVNLLQLKEILPPPIEQDNQALPRYNVLCGNDEIAASIMETQSKGDFALTWPLVGVFEKLSYFDEPLEEALADEETDEYFIEDCTFVPQTTAIKEPIDSSFPDTEREFDAVDSLETLELAIDVSFVEPMASTSDMDATQLINTETSDALDDLLDYAFSHKGANHDSLALLFFQKAWQLYQTSETAPYLAIEIASLMKKRGLYDEAISILTAACNLPLSTDNHPLILELGETIAQLSIIKTILLHNQLGDLPFNQIPADIMKQVDTEYKKWRNSA